MSVNERVRHLRKDLLGLEQKEFAAALGLGQSAVSMMETKTGVSDRNISVICERWGVREEWLRSGEGDVFRREPPISALLRGAPFGCRAELEKAAVRAFAALPADAREVVLREFGA